MNRLEENEGTCALRELVNYHRLMVTLISDKGDVGSLIKVRLISRNGEWIIYLSDEYNEYRQKRTLLGVYLALDALRTYITSNDYLEWCEDLEVDPSNNILRQYYMDLDTNEKQIRAVLGDYIPILELIHFDIPFRDPIDSKILLNEDNYLFD